MYIAHIHDILISATLLLNLIKYTYKQEYIIGEGEYPTSLLSVLQHFTGFMTFVIIFTKKLVSQFVPVHHIPAVVTVAVLYMSHRLASMPTYNKL